MDGSTILGYKLSYLLGADTKALKMTYPVVSAIDERVAYFEGMPASKRYRALSWLYNYIVQNPQPTPIAIEPDGLTDEDKTYFNECGSVRDYIEGIVDAQASIRREVYKELMFEITFEDFELLATLPELDEDEVRRYSVVLQRKVFSQPIVFIQHPMFMVMSGSMLESDRNIHTALCKYWGRQITLGYDNSILRDEYSKLIQEKTLYWESIENFPLIVVVQDRMSDNLLAGLKKLNRDKVVYVPNFNSAQRIMTDGCLVITCAQQDTLEAFLLKTKVRCTIGVYGVIQPKLYSSVLSGKWDNVMLINKKMGKKVKKIKKRPCWCFLQQGLLFSVWELVALTKRSLTLIVFFGSFLILANVAMYLHFYEAPYFDPSDSGLNIVAFQDEKYSTGFLSETIMDLNNRGASISPEVAAKIDEAYAINPDVIGWIRVKEWDIDYPVLLGETNKDYLRTALDGTYDINGSIFMDANYPNVENNIKLIHGHNMENNTFFSNVPSLFSLTDLAKAPKVEYTDINGTKEFSFISVYSADATKESVIITRDWFEMSDLEVVKSELVEKSWVECSSIPSGVEILMLNTCWYGESGQEHNLHCIAAAVRTK